MPLRVVHPVRLVVDRNQVGNEALVNGALATALTAAVAGSVEKVLSGRSPGTGIRLAPADVTWAPSPAPALSQEERDQLAGWIQAAVAGALDANGVCDGIVGDGEPGFGAGEPVDEARIHRALRRYVVPSYAGDDATAVELVMGGEGFEVTYEPPGRDWTPIDGTNLERTYLAELARRDYPVPASGLLGIIFRGRATGLINIGAVRYPDGQLMRNFGLTILTESYVTDAGEIAQRPVALSADSAFGLSWAGSAAEARTVLTRFYAQDYARQLREKVARGALQNRAEYEQAIDDRVAAAIEQQVAANKSAGCFVTLGADGASYLIAMEQPYPDWIADGLNIELIALTEEAPPAGEPGDGDGEKREAQERGERGEHGEQGEQGERGERISLVETAGSEPASGLVYPETSSWGLFALKQTCEPFEGEPPVGKLGEAGAGLKALMAYIAARLEMTPCEYVGAFLIDCGRFLAGRAYQVALAGDLSVGRPEAPSAGIRGNLGDLHFVPTASVSVQLMRQLAGTVPLISRLSREYLAVLEPRASLITGTWSGQFLSWEVRYLKEFTPGTAYGVGQVFAMTSSVLFGQVLRSSAAVIQRALDNLPATSQVFGERVLPMLIGVDQYLSWRDRLQAAIDEDLRQRLVAARYGGQPGPVAPEYVPPPPKAAGAGGAGAEAREAWQGAASRTAGALAGRGGQAPAAAAATSPLAGQVVHTPAGYRILDSAGHPRSIEQLEELIILARGTAESVDPLVKHIDDLPAAVARMRQGPDAVQSELRSILERMSASNKMISERAEADVTYGFAATSIHEDTRQATVPGSQYSLAGIHALADAELKDFMAGDSFYALGIDALMGSELGRKSLTAFAEMVALVAISVYCPPAGIVLGIELAAYHLAEAYERQQVYEALIDPDLVLSRAEVELGLFAAWLGVVLSLFPVLGKLVGALKAAAPVAEAAATAAAAEGEAATGAARMAATGAAEEGALAALRTAEHDLLTQFVRDLAINEALGRAMPLVLTPVLEHLRHELETSAAVGGLDRALALVIARRRAGAPAQPASQREAP